ncbi:MAG TPA: gas vesicle protein GvpO [Streptosporangiaceae bacterium]
MTDRTSTRAPGRERRSRDEAERPSRERRGRDDSERERRAGHRDEDERERRLPRRRQSDGMEAARLAAENVLQLTGRCPENVVSVVREDDGWQVGVEVMELHRIPETTDIMAVYEVILDTNGDLVRCERGQRYHRAQVEEEL